MRSKEFITEKWTKKYKSSINCSHPKGFSQKAHCAGKKKHNESIEMEIVCEDCGMCETHGYHLQHSLDEANRIARKAGQSANSKKHSDLYTDENPRGTITGLKFATVEDARASVSKIRSSGRTHAHKVQAAVAMEQRARAAGKASAAAVYRAYINSVKKTDESLEVYVVQGVCPICHGDMVAEDQITEKQDACYHKVKSRYKVWPSAYASGALVQCRKKGAANWGNKSNESITQEEYDQLDENLKKWFSDKWVRFGPDGKIRGDCARGDDSEGKPKCLPRSKAQSLGKKGRASAAARKRREDPNPERSGSAINVSTKKTTGSKGK